MKESVMNFIKRGMLFLEEGDFDRAQEFFENALNEDAECGEAYFGLLLCDRCCKSESELIDLGLSLDNERNFILAKRFADEEKAKSFEEYPQKIKQAARKKAMVCGDDGNYNLADGWMKRLGEEDTEYGKFYKLGILTNGFSDTSPKIAEKYSIKADALFASIGSDELKEKFSEIHSTYLALIKKAEEEAEAERQRLEQEKIEKKKRAEAERIRKEKLAQEKAEKKKIEEKEAAKRAAETERKRKEREALEKKKKIRTVAIVLVSISAVIAFFIVFGTVIYPSMMYKSATEALEAQDYKSAIRDFTDLEDYKDSAELLKKANYLFAEQYFEAKDYENALAHYKAADDYEDSEQKARESDILFLMNSGDFKGAIERYSLTEITIPAGITKINGYAFSGVTTITTVHVPISVTYIDWGAFQKCSGLIAFYYEGTMQQWNSIGKNWFWDVGTGEYTVYCSDGSLQKPQE